jgi:hypothetical protein
MTVEKLFIVKFYWASPHDDLLIAEIPHPLSGRRVESVFTNIGGIVE